LLSLCNQCCVVIAGFMSIKNDIVIDEFVVDSFESLLDLFLFSLGWSFLFSEEEFLSSY
jgi:hypothetical protein